jgi:hypothetical protein
MNLNRGRKGWFRTCRCGRRGLAVTARTLAWRGFVEQNSLLSDVFVTFVTKITRYIQVRALQREICLLFMIEKRRLPFHRVVTDITILRLAFLRELACVNILVASCAVLRRSAEGYLAYFSARGRRFVTFLASYLCMRSHQWERSLRVIEARQISP